MRGLRVVGACSLGIAVLAAWGCVGSATTATTGSSESSSSSGAAGAGGVAGSGGASTSSGTGGAATSSGTTSSGTSTSSSGSTSTSSGIVGPPKQNHAPHITSAAVLSAVTGKPYYYPAMAQDLDGDALTWSLPQAPATMTIDAKTGLVSWSPGPGDAGVKAVDVHVDDGKGGTDTQSFMLNVAAGSAPPKITSKPPLGAAPGSAYSYQAIAVDPDDTSFTWTITGPPGMMVGATTGLVTWTASGSGNVPVTLTVKDPAGHTDVQAFSIGVATGSFNPPAVSITAPASGAQITGVTSVIGTATAPDLAGYTLSLCQRGWGNNGCTLITNGLAPVSNGVLGKIDTRLFANGGYALTLTATTAEGVSATAAVPVRIHSEDKLGSLRLLFEDLDIDTPGGDIHLERIYDGLDRSRGELGNGWRFRFTISGHGEQPEKPQDGWSLDYIPFPPAFQVSPLYPHPLTFDLQDGRLYDFDLTIEGDGSVASVHSVRPQFQQLTGAPATIEALNSAFVPYSTTSFDLWFNFGVVTEDDVGAIEWVPKYYRLGTDFGETYVFDAKTGEIVDYQDGNGLHVDRLNHSITKNGKPLITFATDAAGLVTAATDTITGAQVKYTRDGNLDLVKVTPADNQIQTYVYAAGSRLTSYSAPGASPEIFEYDAEGRVVKHVDAAGVVTFTQYDDANHRIIQSDAAGNKVTTTYGADGHILGVTDPLGHTTSFTYLAGTNQVASKTDPLGHTWQFGYDTEGRQSTLTDPLGHSLHLGFDDNTGQVTAVTDQEGRVFQTPLDVFGRPNAFVLPSGATARTFSYPNGNTVVTQDAAGHVESFQIDDRGRVTSYKKGNKTWSTAYDDTAHTATFTSPSGTVDTAALDKLGRTTQIDAPGVGTFKYQYGPGDLPSQVTRPDQQIIDLDSDGEGQLAGVKVAGTPTMVVQKNALGQVSSVAGPTGAKSYDYDAAGRVSMVSTTGGSTAITYDAAGRVAAVTTDQGVTESYGYDAADRITSFTNGAGQTVQVSYDKSGKITGAADSMGQYVQLSYDANGRLSGLGYAGGSTTSRTFVASDLSDDEAPIASTTDTDGVTWSYQYDGDDNITQASSAGATTSFVYAEEGRLQTLTDALGHTTHFEWDEVGLTKVTTPAGKVQSYTHDAEGETSSWTRADGSKVTYTRTLDSVTTLLPGGEQHVLSNDPATQATIDSGASGGAVASYEDDDGHVVWMSTADGATVQADYTEEGALAQVTATTPGGATFTTSYDYDTGGRLSKVTDPDGGVTTFAYDGSGRLSGISRPNGTSTVLTYGLLRRPLSIEHFKGATSIQKYAYTYDNGGRVLTATTPAGATTYTYDALGRLASEQVAGMPATQLTYDKVGNLTSRQDAAGTTTRSYDADDQLTSSAAPSGTTTYTYSPRGALTAINAPAGTTTLAYDDLDRLISVTTPDAKVTTYKYDGAGHRLSVTGPDGVERRCLPMPATPFRLDDCAATYGTDPAAEAPAVHVFGPVGVLSRHAAAGARYAWFGLVDSVVALTDPAGAVVGTRAYDAWGNVTGATGEDFDYGFAGERQDAASGLVFLRRRVYDPSTGRFLTPDRADSSGEDPRLLHRYVYALDNPLNRVDPTGEESLVSMMVGINTSQSMQSMKNTVSMCLKKYAQDKIKSLFTELAAKLVTKGLQTVLDQAGALLGRGFAKEKHFHSAIAKILCHWDSFPMLLLGLDDKWDFEYSVDTCGRPKKRNSGKYSYKDCSSGKFSPNSGIDVVYSDTLGIELKLDKKEAAGPRGQGQVVKYCRFGARKGLHLFIYLYNKFPDDLFHVQMARRCWSCWSKLANGPKTCNDAKQPGSIYIALGAKKNKASGKRFFFPKFKKGCSAILGAL